MKVLFFTHHYLDDNSGGSFASRAYINAFTEIADTCMLMYPDRGIPIAGFMHKKCILKGIPNRRNNIQKVIDIYRGRIHRYTQVMLNQIKEFQPDIVVFDNSRTTSGMLDKVKKTGAKTITIHHNYEMEYYRGTKPSIAWRIPFMYYMEKAERTAIRNSDLNLTLTDEDISLLRLHYDTEIKSKIVRLGSFESVADQKPVNDNDQKSNTKEDRQLCFAITGTLGSYQTEVSVIPFLENEYPELLKRVPESKLIIAGRSPSDKMIEACSKYPTVELIANPDDMSEIMNRADIYICPTCVGGGLKLRVMDGLKAGLPVLTHAVSARGYDEFLRANCLFSYENTDTFRSSLDTLLSERSKGTLDGKKIRELYHSFFSFQAGVNRLRGILQQHDMI